MMCNMKQVHWHTCTVYHMAVIDSQDLLDVCQCSVRRTSLDKE